MRAVRTRLLIASVIGVVAAIAILALHSTTKVYALDENQCLSCHSNPLLTKSLAGGGEIPLYVDENAFNTSSAHRFIDCTTCHGSEPHQADSPLSKQSLADKCGSCHQYERELHLESVHGQQLAQGNPDAATCIDCHSTNRNPHSIVRVLESGAAAYKNNIAETCGKCHGNEELMENYGVLEKVYESYMRSFHGKAMQLGKDLSQLDKATCTNCHGTHDIKSVDNPDSPVAGMEHLAETCEQCHSGGGVEFASSFLGHKDVTPETSKPVYYTEKLFLVLTSTVIAFGLLVVTLAIVRWGLNRWKE